MMPIVSVVFLLLNIPKTWWNVLQVHVTHCHFRIQILVLGFCWDVWLCRICPQYMSSWLQSLKFSVAIIWTKWLDYWSSWCSFHVTICRNVVVFCDIVLFYFSSWLQLKISTQEFIHWTCTSRQKRYPHCVNEKFKTGEYRCSLQIAASFVICLKIILHHKCMLAMKVNYFSVICISAELVFDIICISVLITCWYRAVRSFFTPRALCS